MQCVLNKWPESIEKTNNVMQLNAHMHKEMLDSQLRFHPIELHLNTARSPECIEFHSWSICFRLVLSFIVP